MAQFLVMPKFGQTSEEATLVKWRVKEGDTVRKGDVVFEIETDKATMEVESFFEGMLLKIIVPEGETVPVQSPVAILGQPGEAIPDPATWPKPEASSAPASTPPPLASAAAPAPPQTSPPPTPERRPTPATAPATSPPPPSPSAPTRLAASPRARAVARSAALDIRRIPGSGPGGRIVEKDVRAYMEQHGVDRIRITPAAKQKAIREGIHLLDLRPSGADGRIVVADVDRALAERPKPLSRMRQVIAERLTRSATTIPHFYVTVAVDMTDLLAFRNALKAAGHSYTVTAFILEAVALTLREMPAFNSVTDGRTAQWRGAIHLGMAVSLEQGLVVPVIRDADRLTLAELSDAIQALVTKARQGRLTPDEMTGSTFTVSNMGMLNVDHFTAIINPGETAILAVASTRPAPVVRDGRVVVREMMNLTLSSDHRMVDGAQAAAFVNAVKAKLEDVTLWKSLT
jgi:pyruvate dehydrogenase E2 component (dihydrolipoamide acetyltransferase)